MSNIPGDFVRGVRLFAGMSDEEIRDLFAAAGEVRYAAGAEVFASGQAGAALYVILEGQVQLDLESPYLGQTELATLNEQDVFGESSFFHAAPHHASAHCLSDVRLMRLTRKAYDELLAAGSLAAYKLAVNAADVLAERLQHTDEWVERMLQGQQQREWVQKWKRFRRGVRDTASSRAAGFGI